MLVFSFGLLLCSIALFCSWYLVRVTDFGLLYRVAHNNSLWLFYLCANHPVMTRLLQLEMFQWSGIATNTVISVQGGMLVAAVLVSVLTRNPFLIPPLFLLLCEVFMVTAMFMRRKRTHAENNGLENMLRLFLAELNQTKSRRESLGRITGNLTGIWREAVGKLFRCLGNGGDNTIYYSEFAMTFPNNRHVRLLAQLLSYSDTYGGNITDALTRMISDVMADRMEEEKNKSETAATLSIVLIINAMVAITAVYNLVTNPMMSNVLIGTFTGKLLLAVAVVCCFLSLRLTRKIVEE